MHNHTQQMHPPNTNWNIMSIHSNHKYHFLTHRMRHVAAQEQSHFSHVRSGQPWKKLRSLWTACIAIAKWYYIEVFLFLCAIPYIQANRAQNSDDIFSVGFCLQLRNINCIYDFHSFNVWRNVMFFINMGKKDFVIALKKLKLQIPNFNRNTETNYSVILSIWHRIVDAVWAFYYMFGNITFFFRSINAYSSRKTKSHMIVIDEQAMKKLKKKTHTINKMKRKNYHRD